MNTMTAADARAIAARYLDDRYGRTGPAVQVTSIREIDIGWLVLYQSAAYVASRQEADELLGNSPLVVDRDGHIHTTGTSLPVSEYIAEIRTRLAK